MTTSSRGPAPLLAQTSPPNATITACLLVGGLNLLARPPTQARGRTPFGGPGRPINLPTR